MNKIFTFFPAFARTAQFAIHIVICVASFLIVACNSSKPEVESAKLEKVDEDLVINEVMASNRTGVMAEDGCLYDWIEIKNVTNHALSLADYSLVALKDQKNKQENKDGKKGKKKDKKKDKNGDEKEVDEAVEWNFPETELAPGAVALVYASKRDVTQSGKPMHANFKISSQGGCIQIRRGHNGLVSELRYPALDVDQCLRRTSKGDYEKSYQQTPGYVNDEKGYESYNLQIAKQREGSPLLLWEVYPKGAKLKGTKAKPETRGGWVEVKNVSDKPLNLKGYYLATKIEEPQKWAFPDKTLEAGEIYLVEFSKKKFKTGGAAAVLLTKDGRFVDGACAKGVPFGVSIGRKKGKQGFFFYRDQTRGKENDQQARRFIAPMPTFEVAPGIYNDKKTVSVRIDTHGRKVHYTTNGSTPGLSSPVYKGPITLKGTSVIRAYAEGDDNNMRSSVATGTYFLNEKRTLAVMNVSINPGDLFDSRSGMYMLGPGAEKEHPHKGANYWKNTVKPAHVEFYDGKGGSFVADCGLGIFGGFSRAESKKSFKLKFKDIYGCDGLEYDVFGRGETEKFKTLVLRSGSQDIGGIMARDEFFTSLVHKPCPELLVQDYRPIALYINAEYFGLYYIREKIDPDFVSRKLGYDKDSVRIVMAAKYFEEGPDREWKQLMSLLKNKDITNPDVYKEVCSRLDVLGVADHNIFEVFAGNFDMGNVRYVYSPDENSDHKWHLVFYDIDASWSAFPPPAYYFRTSGVEHGNFSGTNNVIINRLIRNKDFRKLYLEQLSKHLHSTLSAKNTTAVFDNLINTIRPEMGYNAERWPKVLPENKWENNVKSFRAKFTTRPKSMLDGLRKELKITKEEEKKYFSDLGY